LLSNAHSRLMVRWFQVQRGDRGPNLIVILDYAKLQKVNGALLIDDSICVFSHPPLKD